MRAGLSLLAILCLVGAAALAGAHFEPGQWYAALRKPPLTPPDWIFAPVWTLLYLGIALAGWLVARSGRRARRALWLWTAQLALNALWSAIFFGLQRPGLAMLEIFILLAFVVMTTTSFLRIHRLAGRLLLPYAAWVAFAAYLNAGIWVLNGAGA
jgi:tryptophan-rich sensory protein